MRSSPIANDIQELYAVTDLPAGTQGSPAGRVLRHLIAARNALEVLEASLAAEPDRWQADSLFAAREGIRHAWLALSNLDRRLKRDGRSGVAGT